MRFGESAINATVNRGNKPGIENTLLGVLKSGDVFYDIGGNIGWYSLLAARRTAAPVIAFEPSLENAAILRQNARTNSLPVSVIPAAVSDINGWAMFLDGGGLVRRLEKDDCPAQAERRAGHAPTYAESVSVPVVTLDVWIAETGHTPPDVVRVDVDGAEVGVLRGMAGTLASAEPVLLIELHGTQREVADFLDEHGYEHAPVQVDMPTRLAPTWVQVLARPRP